MTPTDTNAERITTYGQANVVDQSANARWFGDRLLRLPTPQPISALRSRCPRAHAIHTAATSSRGALRHGCTVINGEVRA